ncbi:MAG: lipoprotein insertase outer membrane protein LolB, partial [Candidatus Dechloromonas phosphoritropha]
AGQVGAVGGPGPGPVGGHPDLAGPFQRDVHVAAWTGAVQGADRGLAGVTGWVQVGVAQRDVGATERVDRVERGDPQPVFVTEPVRQLPGWLLGRGGATANVSSDSAGRPTRLVDAGWQIDFSYPDDNPGALPTLVSLRRGDEIEIRLRIEEWRVAQ